MSPWYISVYTILLYGVHCRKVLKNVPVWAQKDIHGQYIEDITCLPTLLWLEVNFLVEAFPQCTQYIYILIYIKCSKVLQAAV